MDLAHNSVYCIQCILYAYDMPDDVLYCTTRTIYYVCHPICMLFVKKYGGPYFPEAHPRVGGCLGRAANTGQACVVNRISSGEKRVCQAHHSKVLSDFT